ncbi:MAG: DUF4388 domain-containing protein [Candidatus Eisenbacteria bacterium]|uniref:DUF4388 domain-containing protein n=1 Tax=Eiseniibacteriota bacterium TaxID=2212470 RepID=A0A948W808_UNCEI|nr:DUF4388 domain-containing protein [Candidatus Eisenbacteria bacterium]MBU1950727.1 DUF4388 domain-containing protein [Candidatus Eisenbacteria bacterium]MBU2693159.1 DUF4388 domain-containing protein [Candidatus Eisenbacteria bacterium]
MKETRDGTDALAPDLQGRLDTISLFDVCQFLMINRRTGALATKSRGERYKITFLEGQIQEAVGPSLKQGLEALHSVLALRIGEFSFQTCPVPPVDTFQESTDSLLLDAIRLMDERGEGQESGPTELEDRQKRAEELAHLLGRHDAGQSLQERTEPLEEWIKILHQWGARLHVDPRGEVWLESPVSNTHKYNHDLEFREKMLERLLGPRKDRLLEGLAGLVETELGDLWWNRSGKGSALLSLGFVQQSYPPLAELGLSFSDLENPDSDLICIKSSTRLGTSRIVGSLFQDAEAFGTHAGALLSPWATARPESRKGPTLWVPGADTNSLDAMLKQGAAFDDPVLAIEPPLSPSIERLKQLTTSGWRILLGRAESCGSNNYDDLGSTVTHWVFKSLASQPLQYNLVTPSQAA